MSTMRPRYVTAAGKNELKALMPVDREAIGHGVRKRRSNQSRLSPSVHESATVQTTAIDHAAEMVDLTTTLAHLLASGSHRIGCAISAGAAIAGVAPWRARSFRAGADQ
jgi:hypothetical protein